MNKRHARPRGRPRAFDRDDALDRAVQTFWAKGYTATSLDDLTESMEINRPSLYASFGNKHDLFMQSIDRYAETYGRKPLDAFLEQADVVDAVEAYFASTVACVTSPETARGCLIVCVAGERAANDEDVRVKMARAYDDRVEVLAERLRSAQEYGRLPPDPDADSLARMIMAIMHGLAARARVGAGKKELSALARNFLTTLFPERA